MARILAIDYGRKRCGVAVTDVLQIVATGLATVRACDLLKFIKEYVAREQVERIVIGEPRRLNNEPSESMRYIKPFVVQLRKALPDMPIEMFDERFTSTLAHNALIEGGAKRSTRQDKALIDTMAATIILNNYLDSKAFK